MDPRLVLEGILYVLRTGCPWKALPKAYGATSSIHKYFQYWSQEGFFQKIWTSGLHTYDEMEGIGWEWRA